MVFISELKRQEKEQNFLEKAKVKHGDKFDYSKARYESSMASVIIICKKHGEFTQSPAKHISSKYACPKCQQESKMIDSRSFVLQALKLYQGKYVYELYESKRRDEKVRIFCIEHNCYFEQTVRLHLNGHLGCKFCLQHQKSLARKKIDKQDFIDKFVQKYGSEFDFSKVNYINTSTPVLVKCLKHNIEFYQVRKNISRAETCSCPKCKKEARYNRNREMYEFNKREFINLFKKKFGEHYDFSKVEYINNTTPVLVKCLKHNIEFYQVKQNIMRYSVCSCPECKKET